MIREQITCVWTATVSYATLDYLVADWGGLSEDGPMIHFRID